MTREDKREFKVRNPVAKHLHENRGAYKLRTVHPKKKEKPKKIRLADIRKGEYEEE